MNIKSLFLSLSMIAIATTGAYAQNLGSQTGDVTVKSVSQITTDSKGGITVLDGSGKLAIRLDGQGNYDQLLDANQPVTLANGRQITLQSLSAFTMSGKGEQFFVDAEGGQVLRNDGYANFNKVIDTRTTFRYAVNNQEDRLKGISGVAVAANGDQFFLDPVDIKIVRLDSYGNYSKLIDKNTPIAIRGTLRTTRVKSVSGIRFDQAGNLFVVDSEGVQLIQQNFGGAGFTLLLDANTKLRLSPIQVTQVKSLSAVEFDRLGNMILEDTAGFQFLILDAYGNTFRPIDSKTEIRDASTNRLIQLRALSGVGFDNAGNTYLVDSNGNQVIRQDGYGNSFLVLDAETQINLKKNE